MADLTTTINVRFAELLIAGEELFKQFDSNSSVDFKKRPASVSWLFSVINLLEVVLPQGSRHLREAKRLLPRADDTIFPDRIANILGILKSAQAEWSRGLLLDLEFRFVGPAFEEFLRHATEYLADKRKMEAAVLASAVLEDTVKKIVRKFDIDPSDKELDALIGALSAKGALSKVKAQRLRAAAAVRNKAFHADWNSFDERDVKQMIDTVQELVEVDSTMA